MCGDTRNALPGACHQLPRVALFQAKDCRDIAVGIVERLPKDVRGPFGRREPFQHANPERQRFASFRSQARVVADIRWFGQPGSGAQLPA